jgi:poly(A) polymerase
LTQVAREIWQMQPRFARRTGKRPQATLRHPRFRAAYDFLLLRAEAGEGVGELADWWTRFQEGKEVPESQEDQPRRKRRRRRPRGGRRHRPEPGAT